MQMLNIAGYKFTPLDHLDDLKSSLMACCHALEIKGSILLSEEGINVNLSGTESALVSFQTSLQQDERFSDMCFRKTYSQAHSFKRLKIKLKKEIITFRQPHIQPTAKRAKSISPEILKQWLDEKRPITLVDTRNDFEISMGTFHGALNLQLKNFCDFPQAIENMSDEHPKVLFCTGGIRCEKAALYMLNKGFDHVYQLEGGILNYFEKVGQAHYEGACFVFDERVSVTAAK